MDDLIITSGSSSILRCIKSDLSEAFSMTDLGMLRNFIGLEVNQKDLGIMITQSRYIGDFLKRFHMTYCKATSFPFLFGIRFEEGGSTPLDDS